MWPNKTNIETELTKIRDRKRPEKPSLGVVYQVLDEVDAKRKRVHGQLQGKIGKPTGIDLDFDLLETDRIFHLNDIKEICITYRLRFLDAKYFKAPFPEEAITRITELERLHGTPLGNFNIIAPSRLFRLEDRDDPLLFTALGNDYFYLVHKWGNDLHPLRRILVWPFLGLGHLTFTVFLASYLLTALIPLEWFSKMPVAGAFWLIFFFVFKSMAAIVLYYGIALGKNFNPAIWNSRYFNV